MSLSRSSETLTRFARLLSNFALNQDYKEILGAYSLHPWKKGVHQRRELVESNGVLGAVLGHDIKEHAVTPTPDSTRWRESFLKIGAFRKRSVRLEVRRKEFVAEEKALASVPDPLPSQRVRETDAVSKPTIAELNEYIAYADTRLEQDPVDLTEESDRGFEGEKDHRSPIEFRAVPPVGLSIRAPSRRWYAFTWKPAGTRRQFRNRFWSHSSLMLGHTFNRVRIAPSSVRIFTSPIYENWTWSPLFYVEDVVESEKLKIGQLRNSTAIVLEFLEQYFQRRELETKTKKWSPLRSNRRDRTAQSHWEMIQELSNEIRNNKFRFDWETRKHFRAKLYNWNWNRKKSKDQIGKQKGLMVFGDLPPIREQYSKEVYESSFRMKQNEVDSDDET
eukprot:g8488.t1